MTVAYKLIILLISPSHGSALHKLPLVVNNNAICIVIGSTRPVFTWDQIDNTTCTWTTLC